MWKYDSETGKLLIIALSLDILSWFLYSEQVMV